MAFLFLGPQRLPFPSGYKRQREYEEEEDDEEEEYDSEMEDFIEDGSLKNQSQQAGPQPAEFTTPVLSVASWYSTRNTTSVCPKAYQNCYIFLA